MCLTSLRRLLTILITYVTWYVPAGKLVEAHEMSNSLNFSYFLDISFSYIFIIEKLRFDKEMIY